MFCNWSPIRVFHYLSMRRYDSPDNTGSLLLSFKNYGKMIMHFVHMIFRYFVVKIYYQNQRRSE